MKSCVLCHELEIIGEASSNLEKIELPDGTSMWLCKDCLDDIIEQEPPDFDDVRDEFYCYNNN